MRFAEPFDAKICWRRNSLPDFYHLAAWMGLYIGDAATTIVFHFLLCPRVDEVLAVPVHVDASDGSPPHNAMRKQGRRREAEENCCVGFHDDDDDDDDCS